MALPSQVKRSRVSAKNCSAVAAASRSTRAPAEGLWQDDEGVAADRIVIFEVMDDNFDPDWWSRHKGTLQSQFDQEEILIRAIAAVRL